MISETELAPLREAVQSAIDEGRLGTASFMRCVANVEAAAEVGSALDSLVALGETWFGSPPSRRQAVGRDADLYASEVVTWPQGQAAVLAVQSSEEAGYPRFDLMLIGSRGALYHEA